MTPGAGSSAIALVLLLNIGKVGRLGSPDLTGRLDSPGLIGRDGLVLLVLLLESPDLSGSEGRVGSPGFDGTEGLMGVVGALLDGVDVVEELPDNVLLLVFPVVLTFLFRYSVKET